MDEFSKRVPESGGPRNRNRRTQENYKGRSRNDPKFAEKELKLLNCQLLQLLFTPTKQQNTISPFFPSFFANNIRNGNKIDLL